MFTEEHTDWAIKGNGSDGLSVHQIAGGANGSDFLADLRLLLSCYGAIVARLRNKHFICLPRHTVWHNCQVGWGMDECQWHSCLPWQCQAVSAVPAAYTRQDKTTGATPEWMRDIRDEMDYRSPQHL